MQPWLVLNAQSTEEWWSKCCVLKPISVVQAIEHQLQMSWNGLFQRFLQDFETFCAQFARWILAKLWIHVIPNSLQVSIQEHLIIATDIRQMT